MVGYDQVIPDLSYPSALLKMLSTLGHPAGFRGVMKRSLSSWVGWVLNRAAWVGHGQATGSKGNHPHYPNCWNWRFGSIYFKQLRS